MAVSPHLTRSHAASPRRSPVHFDSPLRQRLPSLAPSSASSSAITYVDFDSEEAEAPPNRFVLEGRAARAAQAAQQQLQAETEEPEPQTGAGVVPSSSPDPQIARFLRFGAGGALPSRPSHLPSTFDGLPPSAFTLSQPQPAISTYDRPLLPAQPRTPRRPFAPSRSGTVSSASQRRKLLGPEDNKDADDLLASFLKADRALKENRPSRQRRRDIEQEESEEEVQVEKVRGAGGSDKRRSAQDEGSKGEGEKENLADLPAPAEIGRRTRVKKPLRTADDRFSSSSPEKRRRSRSPTRLPSSPSDHSSSIPPLLKRRKKKAKSTSTSKEQAKASARRTRSKIDSKSSGSSNSGSDRTLTTDKLLKLLPKRVKVFGKDKVDDVDEAETDYDEVVSSPQQGPSTNTRKGKSSRSAAKASKAANRSKPASRRGKKKQQREDFDREEDLAKKEAAKRKWAEVDAYELETELTL
ncbi:hypothetical protein JCM1840_004214 [Sporobolomyces johnsonii]